MTDRLLVIITRMYAPKGGDYDEFKQFWATAEQVNLPHLLFKNITDRECRYVLVIHGYGYPEEVDQLVIDRTCLLVTEGFGELEPLVGERSLSVGLAFHPHPSWIEADFLPLRRGLKSCLEALGVSVEFIKDFAGGGMLDRVLAPQCRSAGTDFVDAFDRAWNVFSDRRGATGSSPAHAEGEEDEAVNLSDYARQLGFLKHELTHLLQPLDIDLQGWEQSDFNPDYGREIIACYRGNKAHDSLMKAQHLVRGGPTERRVSIRAIIEEASRKAGGRARKIEEKWNRLNGLFDLDDFKRAEKLLEALGEESDDAPGRKGTEEILTGLRDKLKAGNDFHLWYVELETVLNELRHLLY